MDATPTTRPRTRRLVAVSAVAVGLCVAGTGVATAAAPTSALSRSVTEILQSAGVDWSTMPDGYTPEQYQAFWGAGYSAENVEELGALWNLDATDAKARAGQLILDGQQVPVTPSGGETAPTVEITAEQLDAFFGAGYTGEDVDALAALWQTEFSETKARAGQMILDGQTPPVAPSGTPATS
ncbi:hypothetical protein [uncultured Cellulomonas sp.]|uniref:hypothetical protein n=1 Tax=uncultured Cellulomonas sp. TaxID=189682 RepID=UPI0028E318A0|nr:hypothetical protein [uncultured Cellulomonas sp.]